MFYLICSKNWVSFLFGTSWKIIFEIEIILPAVGEIQVQVL